jgi:hypothetical protein
METGCPGPFTDVPFAPLVPTTTDSWIKVIKGLWKSLQGFNISLRDDFGPPILSRDKDVFLMPTFLSTYRGPHHHTTCQLLNECRNSLESLPWLTLPWQMAPVWIPVSMKVCPLPTPSPL